MKYKKLLYCLLFIMIPLHNQAQQKPLTLQELTPGGKGYARYQPTTLKQMQFMGERFLYARGDTLYTIGLEGTEKQLCNIAALNIALAEHGDTLKSLPTFSSIIPDRVGFWCKNNFYIYHTLDKLIETTLSLPNKFSDADIHHKSHAIAYTLKGGMGIIKKGYEKFFEALGKDISLGANNVYRNEFGISKGTFWSPSGNSIAFYCQDESEVKDYPLVDISTRQASLQAIKYPMAGMKSAQVKVCVFHLGEENFFYLKTTPSQDRYYTNICWSPDEKEILIAELNRKQDSCQLVAYSAETGKKLRLLFEENGVHYVEPQNPPLFVPNNPKQFIWQSRRDGYNHLYLYNRNGELIKQLTSGEWEVLEVKGYNTTGSELYFEATQNNALEKMAFSLHLSTGKITPLSTEKGIHNILLSPSGRYMTDHYSNTTTPRKIVLTDRKRNKNRTLLTATNPYKGVELPTIEVGTILSADGKTPLNYRLIKPTNFDPNKRYPVIIYVYGGPHVQLINDSWLNGARGFDLYMAMQGYIFFSLDNRGSANRGAAFEQVVHRNLGEAEMADQIEGVKLLQSLPYVDTTRIGVHGWSYGGFMATNLMLTYPQYFKAGVAGGPVIDWKYYEVMYTERYMGTPQNNPIGYANADLKNKISQLQGRLLLIHGDNDPVVVLQHSLSLLAKAVEVGVYPDYFIYPGHQHNVTGKDRVHLHEKIYRYFEDFLK